MLKADVQFGMEEVDIGGTVKSIDVCGFADQLYDAIKKLPESEEDLETMKREAIVLNDVLAAHGLPAIESTASAYRFAQEILHRAIELGKDCRRVWISDDEPALPHDFRD